MVSDPIRPLLPVTRSRRCVNEFSRVKGAARQLRRSSRPLDGSDVVAGRADSLQAKTVQPCSEQREQQAQERHGYEPQGHESRPPPHGVRGPARIDERAEAPRLLSEEAKKPSVRLDLLDLESHRRQKLPVPVGRVATVEVVRLLMKDRAE